MVTLLGLACWQVFDVDLFYLLIVCLVCVFGLVIAVWLLLEGTVWVVAGFDTCVVVGFAVLVVGF